MLQNSLSGNQVASDRSDTARWTSRPVHDTTRVYVRGQHENNESDCTYNSNLAASVAVDIGFDRPILHSAMTAVAVDTEWLSHLGGKEDWDERAGQQH